MDIDFQLYIERVFYSSWVAIGFFVEENTAVSWINKNVSKSIHVQPAKHLG